MQYGPWGYGYPPPIYPPTQPYQVPVVPTPSDLERGYKLAMKIRQKEERKDEKKKEAEGKKKADEKKHAEASRSRNLNAIEWFIVGILASPIVGPAYQYLTHVMAR